MPDPVIINALSSIGLTGGTLVALWAFVTGRVVTGQQIERAEKACSERTSRLEVKLDESTAIILRQADSQQAQIVAQQQMIATQQSLLQRLEGKTA